jgi:homoserine O-acetyltransferase/O-succinyltransferase
MKWIRLRWLKSQTCSLSHNRLVDSSIMKPSSAIHRSRLRRIALSFAALSFVLVVAAVPLVHAATADGEQQFAELGACKLESGQQIADCRLGYRTWGKLNADQSNAILFPTWLLGQSADIASQVGSDKMIDPAKYFLVVVDSLGNGVSSSPSNSKTQPRMTFPAFTVRDMVSTEYRLVTETLHLKHLHAVMGISMGGIQSFEWIVDYPDFIDLAIPIVGTTRMTSYDLLLWHAEEDAIRADPAWHNGDYAKSPSTAMVNILHKMHLTTTADFSAQVKREDFAAAYAKLVDPGSNTVDENNYLYQLEAIIHHDIAHGGAMEEAAKRVKAKVLVVPAQQDHMVNPAPAEEFAKLIGAKVFLLTSDCGHQSPGCEAAKLDPVVQAFLATQ